MTIDAHAYTTACRPSSRSLPTGDAPDVEWKMVQKDWEKMVQKNDFRRHVVPLLFKHHLVAEAL